MIYGKYTRLSQKAELQFGIVLGFDGPEYYLSP